MPSRYEQLVMPLGTLVLALAAFAWWLGVSSGEVAPRLPGEDGVPDSTANQNEAVAVAAGQPVAGDGQSSQLSGSWSGFRGDNRDGVAVDGPPLARSWPVDGPPILWSRELGEGYASAAIADGCVFVLDYDEEAGADTLRCLSLDDGREIWRNAYPVQLTRNHGLSRTTPAVSGGKVVTIGPRCHVACWDAESGQCEWLIDLVQDHQAELPRWYCGQCPLIDGDRVILAPCGDSLLMAVDLATGEVLWKTPNTRKWEMTHVSVMPMQHGGKKSYVYCGSGGVAAVSADDGQLLWDNTNWPMVFATCPSPLVLPEGRVLLSSGYGRSVGSLLIQVDAKENAWSGETLKELTPKQFNSEQHTPILYEDHIYGVRKRGGGQLVCMDVQGRELWNSGKDRFGHGPYLIADGLVFVMDDHGVLTMAEATADGYKRLGRTEVFPEGHDAWGPMAIVDGRLVVREMTRMACLNVAEK